MPESTPVAEPPKTETPVVAPPKEQPVQTSIPTSEITLQPTLTPDGPKAPSGDLKAVVKAALDKAQARTDAKTKAKAETPAESPKEPKEATIELKKEPEATPAPTETQSLLQKVGGEPTAKATDITPSPPVAIQDDDDDDDKGDKVELPLDEVEKRLRDPHVSPAIKRILRKSLKVYKKAEEDRRAWTETEQRLTREREEASAKITPPEDYEPTKKKLTEVEAENLQFKRRYMLEKDPAFLKDLNDRQAISTKAIESILQKTGLPEKSFKVPVEGGGERDGLSLEYIRNKGGFASFARSHKDAYKQIVAWFNENDPLSGDALRGHISDIDRAEVEKGERLNTESAKSKEYFEGLTKKEQEQMAQSQEAQKSYVTALQKHREDLFAKDDLFKTKEIPANAKEPDIVKLKAENAKAEESRQLLAKLHDVALLGKGQPADIARACYEFVRLARKSEQVPALEKENKELRAEIEGLKKSRQVTPAPRAAANNSPAANGAVPFGQDGKPLTAAESLKRGLDAREAAKRQQASPSLIR